MVCGLVMSGWIVGALLVGATGMVGVSQGHPGAKEFLWFAIQGTPRHRKSYGSGAPGYPRSTPGVPQSTPGVPPGTPGVPWGPSGTPQSTTLGLGPPGYRRLHWGSQGYAEVYSGYP